LGIDVKDIELSMGMSNDYEHAVRSLNNVLINSIILFLWNASIIFYYRLNLAVQMWE